MSNRRPVHPDLAKLIDKVWKLKAVCEDLEPRRISEADAVAIASIDRDLDRSVARLVGIRDKRKRDKSDDINDTRPQLLLAASNGAEAE